MENLSGKTFNRLVVVNFIKINKQGSRLWECKCTCGNIKLVTTANLNAGRIKSCGCLREEGSYKHGYSSKQKHPLYQVYQDMKGRCYSQTHHAYLDYGDRGVTICKEWVTDVTVFISWALANGYKKGLEIDRIENNGNYSPDNCRFVTHLINGRNKRLLFKSNKTGYCGVSLKKISGKFEAKCNSKHIGTFCNKIDAAVARDVYVNNEKLGLPLNFIQPLRGIIS